MTKTRETSEALCKVPATAGLQKVNWWDYFSHFLSISPFQSFPVTITALMSNTNLEFTWDFTDCWLSRLSFSLQRVLQLDSLYFLRSWSRPEKLSWLQIMHQKMQSCSLNIQSLLKICTVEMDKIHTYYYFQTYAVARFSIFSLKPFAPSFKRLKKVKQPNRYGKLFPNSFPYLKTGLIFYVSVLKIKRQFVIFQ